MDRRLLGGGLKERCKCDVIIDAFCGAGGNAIQFAKACKR
jgi:trimethylguanosine synthase